MKKTISLLLSLVMLFSITAGIDLSAYAAGNSISNATSISFNSQYSGYITTSNTTDVYKFSMSSSGKINVSVEANISASTYHIYDANGNTLWTGDCYRWNDNTQLMTFNQELDLTKGTYYFSVNDYYGSTGNYSFKVTFTSANESFSEPQGGNNNSIATANGIVFGNTYKGQLAVNDNTDLYKFSLSSSGRITISVKANISSSSYYIYDVNGNTLWEGYCYRWNDNTKQMTYDQELDLTKGTYYFSVRDYYGTTGNYSFNISFTSANESFSEPQGGNNNSIATANEIVLGNTYKGQLAVNDNTDLYKFSLSSSGRITISVKANISSSSYYIYDVNGNTLWEGYCYRWNDNTKQMTYDQELDLSKGTYYFSVRDYYGTTGNYSFNIHTHTYNSYTTNATISADGKTVYKCTVCGNTAATKVIPRISSVTLSGTSYTYSGKVYSPAVTVKDRTGKTLVKNTDYTVSYASGRKNVGKYAVKVTFKG
ncbi:MAG: pre-peptidase C-terminal domain-containing protein, partial [Eubacterium sp.]